MAFKMQIASAAAESRTDGESNIYLKENEICPTQSGSLGPFAARPVVRIIGAASAGGDADDDGPRK